MSLLPYFRGQRWNVGRANEIADRIIIEKSTRNSHMLDVSMIIMVSYTAKDVDEAIAAVCLELSYSKLREKQEEVVKHFLRGRRVC